MTSPAANRPAGSTPTTVQSSVARAHASSTAECSTAVVTTCRRPSPARARSSAPQTAVFTASVPVAVNTTSRGRAPNSAATCSRAFSTATRVVRPSWWMRPGSPGWPREERQHGVERGRAQDRGRRVVEVGARHGVAQTRATQWSSPSGRLSSKCGDVSP